MRQDVLVLGSGPAGVAAAAACSAAGLGVRLIAPTPRAPWVPTYASFDDELPAEVPRLHRWGAATVHLQRDEIVTVDRPYARVDSGLLHARLWEQARGVAVTDGRAVKVGPVGGSCVVVDGAGHEHTAAVVIDATGVRTAGSFQTAYGLVAEIDGPGVGELDPARARWMDFSTSFGDGREVPTFLYALPYANGTWLLEETALIRSPRVSFDLLEERLHDRLARLGVRLRRVLETERCTIPMDVPIPTSGPTLGFGTAGGMVHPATGFQLARALRAAPRLAAAIAEGLQHSPARALELGRAALWPSDTRRRHRIYRFGAKAMAGLSATHTRAFFRAFFSMPPAFVHGFLSDGLSTQELVSGMSTMFPRLPSSVRWRLFHLGSATELARAAMSRTQPVASEPPAEVSP